MDINTADKIDCTANVKIKNGKVYRHIYDINLYKKLIDIIKCNNLFNSYIIYTEISKEEENLLEHEYIPAITESGEYTESMAFDVTETAIELSLKLFDCGICSFDLMPHNFSFNKGKWILHDFDGINFDKKRVKSQIRGIFKISFSNFEITKKLHRKYLKHYYLNRIKNEDLAKMIKFTDMFIFSLKLLTALIICNLGFYKQSYKCLQNTLKKYKKTYKKEIYKPIYNNTDKEIYCFINELLIKDDINSVFCCGEENAKWTAIVNTPDIFKFVYIDDYDICDSFYNYITANNITNISTAVVYPLLDDNEISASYKYRAIYDTYAQQRFKYDSVIIPDVSETFEQNQNQDEYITNISNFCTKLLILRLKPPFEKELEYNFVNKLKYMFEDVNKYEIDGNIIIYAKNKKYFTKDKKEYKTYKNGNRGTEADIQTRKILEILNK